MSFSATILFSPPGGSEARCCCCACKSETGASSTGSQGGNPPASTPITVTGHGLAVQSPEQLLHIIYQRVEKAVGLAEAALGLARANNELLKRLQEEVGELKQGKASAPDEDEVSRAHGSPPEEPGPLKESPGEACKASAAAGAEEDCDSVGSGMQVVIEELWQVGATAAGAPGPLGFPAAQRDMRLPGCALAASEAAPMLNPVSMAPEQTAGVVSVAWLLLRASRSLVLSSSSLPQVSFQPAAFLQVSLGLKQDSTNFPLLAGLVVAPPLSSASQPLGQGGRFWWVWWPLCLSLPLCSSAVLPSPPRLAWLLPGLCGSWPGGLPCTDGSFIFYHGPSACQEEFSTEREGGI